jgi:type II restriction/modification system DNA methylase subunit YeeA
MQRNGFGIARNPILRPLDTIECRDAILSPEGSEAEWPTADVIIGNPPFLGDKLMISTLGEEYVATLRAAYAGLVPGGAHLVCYWFEKARRKITSGEADRAGLVATNSIRGGANRVVLDRICATGRIFEAWSDEPWILEGAAVRVSLISFTNDNSSVPLLVRLDGTQVDSVFPDLRGRGVDLTKSMPLEENLGRAFSGITKKGKFDVPGLIAREMLCTPANPDGSKNSDVLFPWKNGEAITYRDPDKWIIHFAERAERDALLYETPFRHVVRFVKPERDRSGSKAERRLWWLLARRAPDMFAAIADLARYIVTPEVSKHRIFKWLPKGVIPDKNLVVIAKDDDTTFGILQSGFHEVWALRLGTSLEDRPRYTSSTTFRSFPFPEGLTPNVTAAEYASDPRAVRIAEVARRLNELRGAWLNPPDLVVRVPEVVPGYPERILPKDEDCAKELKKRTLTNLYNQRPAWLDNAHRELDEAVAAAYGWPADLSDDEILKRLFELNQERAGARDRADALPRAAVA